MPAKTALSATSELLVHFLTPLHTKVHLFTTILHFQMTPVHYCPQDNTWVPKTIQSQDGMSGGSPPHKKAVVHYMPEGSVSLRNFAFVWGRRQFSHLQTCWCLSFFLSVFAEFFSPLFSATCTFSLVISELPWLAGMQGAGKHITFLTTQSIVILTFLFFSPSVSQFTFPLDNGKFSAVINVAK